MSDSEDNLSTTKPVALLALACTVSKAHW
jgi:hypothetical protein